MIQLAVTFCLLVSASQADEEKVGGLTISEWNTKCLLYFEENGKSPPEKAFQIPGHCEQYVCQSFQKGYGMRIDECSETLVNGISCQKLENVTVKNLKYPDCCPKYNCDIMGVK